MYFLRAIVIHILENYLYFMTTNYLSISMIMCELNGFAKPLILELCVRQLLLRDIRVKSDI